MQNWSFYQSHLARVSRSFSFCIAQLSTPHRDWIALAYLLFRIIDTIEDAPWSSKDPQLAQFHTFKNLLMTETSNIDIKHWLTAFPEQIDPGEKKLLADTHILLEDFRGLPTLAKHTLQQKLTQMMAGMEHFISKSHDGNALILKNNQELDQYCFFVAGLVGELLTVLFADQLTDLVIDDELYFYAFHFGLFLQKINILKDEQQDALAGRSFVTDRAALRKSVETHAACALAYIKRIPIEQGKSIRLFCCWSLFIGLASLKYIDKSYQKGKNYKMPRAETLAVIYTIRKHIKCNAALTNLFQDFLPTTIKPKMPSETANTSSQLPAWFTTIYPNASIVSQVLLSE